MKGMVDTGVVDARGVLALPVAAVPSPDSTLVTAFAVKPRRGSRGGVDAAAPIGAGGTSNVKKKDVLLLCRVPAGLNVGATEAGVGRDIVVIGVEVGDFYTLNCEFFHHQAFFLVTLSFHFWHL